MMTDTLTLAWVLGAGIMLGVFFFGGLWWTVRMCSTSRYPGLLFLSSFLLRTSIVMAGIYLVAGTRWDQLLACLFGFVIARFIVAKLTELPVARRTSLVKESGHASQS